MSVIGNLDKQVNDILIAPLTHQNASPNEIHQEIDASQGKIEQPRDRVTKNESAKTENGTTEAEKMSGAQASLPVWLL